MSQDNQKPVRVGLLGIGTVGGGTFTVLKRNQEEIRRRAGRGISIDMVADLNVARAKELVGDAPHNLLSTHLASERDHFVKNLHHANAGTGIAAFLDKRTPLYE